MANKCFDALRKELPKEISDKEIKDFLSQAEEIRNLSEGMGEFRQKMMAKLEAQRQTLAMFKQRAVTDQFKLREKIRTASDPNNYNGDAVDSAFKTFNGSASNIAEGGNRSMQSEYSGYRNQMGNPFLDAI